MTDTDKNPKMLGEASRLEVSRDITFSRSAADQVVVMDLGKDFEIAFLQVSPEVVARVRTVGDEGEEEGFQMKPQMFETSRVRIGAVTASDLAMQLLNELADRNEFNADALRENIETIIASHSAKDEDGRE